MPVTRRKTRPPQRRRSAEQARREILDTAEQQLRVRGPDSIRLQDVARAVGISHPTVLYHFGSRNELVQAVVVRAFENLQTELVGAFQITEVGLRETVSMLERAFEILSKRGFARMLAWLLLANDHLPPPAAAAQIQKVAQVAHAKRRRAAGAGAADYEDTVFLMLLGALVTFAEGVAGEALLESAGLAGDHDAARRFRVWFAKLLVEHVERTQEKPAPRKRR